MVWKTVKHSLQIVAAVFAGIALLVLVAAWKLSQGPISLPQLTPYIIDAVSSNTRGMHVKIKDTILSWEGWDRTLDIRVIGTSIFTRDGRLLTNIPEASISLSGSALVKGIAAPSSVELIKPRIHLLRHSDGQFAFEFGDGMTVRADRAFDLDQFLAKEPDLSRPLSYLRKIVIDRGVFEYIDKNSNTTYEAPNTTLVMERIGETVVFDTGLELFLNDKPAKIDLNASYNLTTEIIDAHTTVHTLYLSDLAHLLPELSVMEPFEFSIEGKADIALDKNGKVRSFFADVKSTDGSLQIPAPAVQTLDIDALSLRVGYEDFNSKIRIEEALLSLTKGSMVRIPAPLQHFMPLEQIRFEGDYDTNNDILNLDVLNFDLGEGPTGSIKGNVTGVLTHKNRSIDLTGELLNVEPSRLSRYWPKGLNDDARDWIVNHIHDGIVHRAGIEAKVSLNELGDVQIDHISGDMQMEGLSVDYLRPLPTAKNATGWAKFDHDSFNVTVTSGGIGDIQVKTAQIDITGLDEYDQRLTLDMTLSSPLRDTLEFVDKEPLGFAKALGIEPAKTSGHAETNLKMSFLLLDALTWDGVDVSAKAKGTDITISDVIFKQPLSKGEIELDVNKDGMDVSGDIVLGSIPAKLKWRENFDKQTLFKRRFLLDGEINDHQRINELRLDFPPFNGDVMKGPVHIDATITENWDGQGILETFVDLKGASLNIPIVHWQKTAEQAGEAYAKLTFTKKRLIGVPYFSVSSDDLKASGSLTMNKTGDQLHTMNITRFQAGRTDIAGGTVLYSPQSGWEVDVHGKSLDLTKQIADDRNSKETTKPQNDNTDLPGTFSGRFDKVWLDDEHSLNTVAGAVSSDGKLWNQAHVTGVVGGGKPFTIDLSPENENRRLKMETKDAGALLRALDFFDDMQGGDLLIEGVFNDEQPRRPLVGNIRVDDYRITKVPALAKMLSLVALTGVVDSLQGDGIGFTSLTSPFMYDDGVVEFKDGRTNGISIGLTWQGKLYTYAKVADMQGTVVPAYGLNSLLGNVPILGNLFSAGEKGGGLFAWTYKVTGSLDDPDVSVNPVSALAPGVLRKLFQIGDGVDPKVEQPSQQPLTD